MAKRRTKLAKQRAKMKVLKEQQMKHPGGASKYALKQQRRAQVSSGHASATPVLVAPVQNQDS